MVTGEGHGKISLSIGGISFSGEGDQEWLEVLLNKVLDAAKDDALSAPVAAEFNVGDAKDYAPTATDALASYIKSTSSDTTQVRRFLATALWLQDRGAIELTTTMVAKALRDNRQKKLGNPSDCLGQNVSKGYCEKTSNGFFVTDDGRAWLSGR